MIDIKGDMYMETKKIVRYLTTPIESRKEILKIVYCRGCEKGKRIENWINLEMLAKLLELKEKNEVEECEGEHGYDIPKRPTSRRVERCDLWWYKNNEKHWLEVKTTRLHHDSDGLKKKYGKRIEGDLKRIEKLKPPYDFHHLLMVFDDKDYSTGNWREDVYSLYRVYQMTKEDEWKFDAAPRKTVHVFLHHIKK